MASVAIDINLVLDAAAVDGAVLSERDLAAAWVTASASRTEDPAAYDDRLARILNQSESLRPVPVLLPPTGTTGAYARARAIVHRSPLHVVRLCPTGHRYPLADWVLSPIPELCERMSFTLLLDFAPADPPWLEVVSFARAFPSVPTVLLGVGAERAAPAALDAAPNLILQLEGSFSPELVAIYGGSRFVAAAVSADLPERDRELILHGNADALADGSYAEQWL
jgi:predicted TIM-barrel fold metal-dependent hydrolase